MKVGDYVRLPDGIHKIKHYEYRPEYENCHCMYLDDNDYGLLFTNKDLIKSSPNIIDLIEVGDYVNGRLVEWKSEDFVAFGRLDYAYEEDIKSIITKEQFSSMEYKVN